jgi:hypothetical protein
VGLGRLELPTSPLSGVRSSHLSYRPNLLAGIILRDLAHSSNNGAASVSRSAGIKKLASISEYERFCKAIGTDCRAPATLLPAWRPNVCRGFLRVDSRAGY